MAGTVQDGAFQDGGDEPAGDAGARRVPAGVQDARRRVRRFQAQGRSAVGTRVEVHAVAAQAGDVPDGLGAQDPHGLGVVQPGAGGERVGDVRCHGVAGGGILRRQHGRDAALGVEGVALLQRPLAQEDHLDVVAAVAARRWRAARRRAPRSRCRRSRAAWSRPRRQHALERHLRRGGDVVVHGDAVEHLAAGPALPAPRRGSRGGCGTSWSRGRSPGRGRRSCAAGIPRRAGSPG